MKENEIEEGFWVFVSHSTKDFEKVRLVRNALEDKWIPSYSLLFKVYGE